MKEDRFIYWELMSNRVLIVLREIAIIIVVMRTYMSEETATILKLL